MVQCICPLHNTPQRIVFVRSRMLQRIGLGEPAPQKVIGVAGLLALPVGNLGDVACTVVGIRCGVSGFVLFCEDAAHGVVGVYFEVPGAVSYFEEIARRVSHYHYISISRACIVYDIFFAMREFSSHIVVVRKAGGLRFRLLFVQRSLFLKWEYI